MSLKITKDRSNIDVYSNEESIEESIEEFIGNLNKAFDSLSISTNSTKDALNKWDSSYKIYNNIMGDITTIKDYNALFY